VQEGSEGCRMAQESDVISGCAGEVMGEIFWRVGGRVVLLGKRMGETNFLEGCWLVFDIWAGWELTYGYFRRAISARASTCSYAPGQGRVAG